MGRDFTLIGAWTDGLWRPRIACHHPLEDDTKANTFAVIEADDHFTISPEGASGGLLLCT